MPKVLRDGTHNQEFIVWESDGNVCRDNCVLAAGQVLQRGTVVEGPDSALVAYDSGPATGVVTDAYNATDGDVACVKIARGPIELAESMLIFQSGASNQDKLDAYGDLKALGVIVRRSGDGTTTGTW